MEKFTKYVLVVMLSLISFTAFPQDTTAIKKRPKIGLVLSGGGATSTITTRQIGWVRELDTRSIQRPDLLTLILAHRTYPQA